MSESKRQEFVVVDGTRVSDAALHDPILAAGDARPEDAIVREDRRRRLRRLGFSDAEIAMLYEQSSSEASAAE
jgi:hypothetical protein